MLLAQHLESLLSLDNLVTPASVTAFTRASVLAIAGLTVLATMSLPIFSLPGLGMLGAALLVTRIIHEAERMQAEAEALDHEHHLQVEMADQLMLTPPSIKS